MKTNIIKSYRDYNAIAKRIEELVNAEPKTPAALELKEHICTIIAYEQQKRQGISNPFPVKKNNSEC